MTYNITYSTPSLIGYFELLNGIVPYASTVFLLVVPYIILLIALSRYSPKISFGVTSFIMSIMAVILSVTGLVSWWVVSVFITLSVIGFVWLSVSD